MVKQTTIYNREKSPLHKKSKAFAVRVVNMIAHIRLKPILFPMASQLIRSATAVGALVREAEFAQSQADFINKLYVALKEANEAAYWIEVFNESKIITDKWSESLLVDCNELVAMLVSSIKTSKSRQAQEK